MLQHDFGHVALLTVALIAVVGVTPIDSPAGQRPVRVVAASAPSMPVIRTGTSAQQNLQREVFGFALSSSLSDPTVGYPSWNFSLLSTVAYFGLHIGDDGWVVADSGWTVWNSAALTGLVSTAHASGTRVVVSMVLQDFSAGTPHMCSGLANYGNTVAAAVSQAQAKGVDGVNLDFEGLNGSCGTSDSAWARHMFSNLAATMRRQLPTGMYLSVDTYASSAGDPLGFFDIPTLGQFVDSFFVMAYDLEYSNYRRPPTSCSSFCLGPTSPLGGYYYNDGAVVANYKAVVSPSQVILGVPYYGRKACVGSAVPNAYPTGGVVADSYLDAVGEATAAGVQAGSYVSHRDANDPAGQERWDTWYNTDLGCTRELYWDDTDSLGLKYDLVNTSGVRGVGIWNLNYGGGAQELWNLVQTKFGTGWGSIGGPTTSDSGAASWGTTRLDVFARSSSNGLIHNAWDGTQWLGWEVLDGYLTASPDAVSPAANRVDIFTRAGDNAVWHKYWNGTAWQPWERLGGNVGSGPAVASWGASRLDVFVVGVDNAMYHKYWDGTAWHGWESLGGYVASDPAAVSWGQNRLDVFVRGTDNRLYHKAWDIAGWHAWESLGGDLVSNPAAASCASGRLDVFAVGSDRSLWRRAWNGSAWTPWVRVGGYWTGGPSAVCRPGMTVEEVFERGSDQAVWHKTVPATV